MKLDKNFQNNILVFIKNIEDKNIYFEVFFLKKYKEIKIFDWRDVIYLVIKEKDNNVVFYPRTIIDGFERNDDRCLFSIDSTDGWFLSKKFEITKKMVENIIQSHM